MTVLNAETLNANNDINGKAIVVGSRVRSFDFPLATKEGIIGMDVVGNSAHYMEGVVEAIGEDDIEGCPRYRIRADKIVRSGFADEINALIYPPLNSTPSLCGVTFGVVVA